MEEVFFFSTAEPGCIFSSVGIYGLGVQLLKLKVAKLTFSSNKKCVAKCHKISSDLQEELFRCE